MRPILALALKDLRVLPRIRMAFFFTFIWPVIVAVMFGYAFSGSGDATRAMKIAVVDDDGALLGLIPPERMLTVLLQEHEEDIARFSGLLANSRGARIAGEERVG